MMRLTFAAVAACSAAFAFAGRLAVISVEDPGGYALSKSRDSAELVKLADAGKRVLALARTDNDFERFAEGVSAVAFEDVPERHLVRGWRAMRVKTFLAMRFDSVSTPEFFRRRGGFAAWRSGVDGLLLGKGSDKWPKAWSAALEAARVDHALCEELVDLAVRCGKSSDAGVRALGRRGLAWLEAMDVEESELDCLRAETWAYAARLAKALGEAEPKRPDFPLAGPDGAAWYRVADPGAVRAKKTTSLAAKVRMDAKEAVPGASFSSNRDGFEFSFTCAEGPKLGKDEWPGGELTFDLLMPSDGGKDLMAYRFRMDLRPVETNLCWLMGWGSYYANERRFSFPGEDRLELVPRRSWGPTCPKPEAKFSFARGANGGWTAAVRCSWTPFFNQWPATRSDYNAIWLCEATRTQHLADGRCVSKPFCDPFKVSWLHGSQTNWEFFFKATKFASMAKAFDKAYGEERRRLVFMDKERWYWHDAQPAESFARNDHAADKLYAEAVVEPMEFGPEGKASRMLAAGKKGDEAPQVFSAQPHVRAQVLADVPKVQHFGWHLDVARRDFLLERFAGRTPKPPKLSAAAAARKEQQKPVKTPNLELDDGGDIELDDTEY